jgi:hypothetical protein
MFVTNMIQITGMKRTISFSAKKLPDTLQSGQGSYQGDRKVEEHGRAMTFSPKYRELNVRRVVIKSATWKLSTPHMTVRINLAVSIRCLGL